MTGRALERRLELWREQVNRDVAAAIDAATSELRDDLHTAIAAVDQRVTNVHAAALRALTDAVKKGS